MAKRIIPFILVLTLVCSLFAGCSKDKETEKTQVDAAEATSASDKTKDKDNETKEEAPDYGDTGGLKLPIVDELIHVSCINTQNFPNRSESIAIKELAKRTNIQLDIQEIPDTTATEKVKMIIASGDLPDFINVGKLESERLGLEGALVPLNKYIDELPNFKKLFIEENPWVLKSYSAPDDNLYFWPMYNIERDVNHGYMYRKDVFDKHGLKEWNNTEEFYQVLKKLKELYPESYPWANKYNERLFEQIAYGWGVGGLDFPVYYDEDSKMWKGVGGDPAWKDMLDFMKKLYNEGLLDQEFLTATAADFAAKMTNGTSFVCFDWIGRMKILRNQVIDKIPEYDLRYANPVGPKGKIRRLPRVSPTGPSVKDGKNKMAVMKLLDYLSSPSGMELITLGIEGETYNRDANGKITYPGFPADKELNFNDLSEKFGVFLMGIYTRVHPESLYFTYTEREQEAQDKMLNNDKIEIPDPVLKFTEEEKEVVDELKDIVYKEVLQFASKYVVDSNYGEKEWNEWVNQIDTVGQSRLVEVYNSAQKRYDSN